MKSNDRSHTPENQIPTLNPPQLVCPCSHNMDKLVLVHFVSSALIFERKNELHSQPTCLCSHPFRFLVRSRSIKLGREEKWSCTALCTYIPNSTTGRTHDSPPIRVIEHYSIPIRWTAWALLHCVMSTGFCVELNLLEVPSRVATSKSVVHSHK